MRALVVTNGYLQPMLFGGMRRVVDNLRMNLPDDCQLKFFRWRDYDGILAWLDELELDYANFLGYSYGASTNAFVAKARPRLRIKYFIGVDPIWRPEIQKIEPDSLQEEHSIDLLDTGVEQAVTYVQSNGILTGHMLTLNDDVVEQRIVISCNHVKRLGHLRIDDLPSVIDACTRMMLS